MHHAPHNNAIFREPPRAVVSRVSDGRFLIRKPICAGHTSASIPAHTVPSEAPQQIQKMYLGYRVPDEYRKRGAANPIKHARAA